MLNFGSHSATVFAAVAMQLIIALNGAIDNVCFDCSQFFPVKCRPVDNNPFMWDARDEVNYKFDTRHKQKEYKDCVPDYIRIVGTLRSVMCIPHKTLGCNLLINTTYEEEISMIDDCEECADLGRCHIRPTKAYDSYNETSGVAMASVSALATSFIGFNFLTPTKSTSCLLMFCAILL